MSLSLRHLRYFVATAQTGQGPRPAREVNVSQSAVTGAIRQIETRIGTRLFERHSTGVTLTFEGSRFLQHARNIVASVNEALRVPTAAAATVRGNLRIGATYPVPGYFFPQHHALFARSYPAVTIELREAPRPVIEEDLLAGRLDFTELFCLSMR